MRTPAEADGPWLLPARTPVEVVCHGDFAPYNVVLDGPRAVGIIDFDMAHPGPRVWDIAYALYRWAPLTRPANRDGFDTLAEQIERAALFCDSYGLATAARTGIVGVICARSKALVDFLIEAAAADDEAFLADMAAGHHRTYLADIACLRDNQAQIETLLLT